MFFFRVREWEVIVYQGIFDSLIDRDGGRVTRRTREKQDFGFVGSFGREKKRGRHRNPPTSNKKTPPQLSDQRLPAIPPAPLPDIELTPLKTSAPTSRIAPPALIKGRVNEILRFR